AHRHRRRDREPRDEPRPGPERRAVRHLDPRPGPPEGRLADAEGRVGGRGHPLGRPRPALRRGRRGRPPRLADPALARPRHGAGRQRRGQRPRLPGGGRRRGPDPRLRLLGRRVLPRSEGSPGRRVMADGRRAVVVLQQAQGGGRADPRPLRDGEPGHPRRADPSRSRLQAGGRHRHPSAVRGTVPAEPAAPARAAAAPAGVAVATPPGRPGRPLAGRRRRVPPSAADRRAGRLQHRRRAGARRARARPSARGPARARACLRRARRRRGVLAPAAAADAVRLARPRPERPAARHHPGGHGARLDAAAHGRRGARGARRRAPRRRRPGHAAALWQDGRTVPDPRDPDRHRRPLDL
ncbi:MAG: Nucleoside-diphosphate-sugar epimerases, partial [uncultured Thermoleophilia bacterium]